MSNAPKRVKVATTKALNDALAAGFEASQIDIDTTDAIAAARAEGFAEGKASVSVEDAKAAAVTAERSRIAAVQALTRPGFEGLVAKGIEAGQSPADVALAIMTAAADRGITLDAIRKDAPPPAPHANPQDHDPKAGKSWDEIQAAAAAPKRM